MSISVKRIKIKAQLDDDALIKKIKRFAPAPSIYPFTKSLFSCSVG